MPRPIYVYALAAPGSTDPVYIGRSHDPVDRLNSHASKSGAKRIRQWLAGLGTPPNLLILRECATEPEAQLSERAAIAEARLRGLKLLNSTRGGEPARVRYEMIPPELGARVRARRKELGMTAAALSKATGIGQPSLSRLETHARGLSLIGGVRLAHALGTTVEWLVTGENTQRSEPAKAAQS